MGNPFLVRPVAHRRFPRSLSRSTPGSVSAVARRCPDGCCSRMFLAAIFILACGGPIGSTCSSCDNHCQNSVGSGAVEVNKNRATQIVKTSAFFVLALCHSGNPRQGAVSPEVVQAKNGSLKEARRKLSMMRGKATGHAWVFRPANWSG